MNINTKWKWLPKKSKGLIILLKTKIKKFKTLQDWFNKVKLLKETWPN